MWLVCVVLQTGWSEAIWVWESLPEDETPAVELGRDSCENEIGPWVSVVYDVWVGHRAWWKKWMQKAFSPEVWMSFCVMKCMQSPVVSHVYGAPSVALLSIRPTIRRTTRSHRLLAVIDVSGPSERPEVPF